MSVCFKPNGPFWTLCGYLKEPKVGKLDLLWFVLLPMKGFRVTWTFSGPHLVRWVISASGCVNWTPSRLPKREWFLPNFGLRLNFAIADYLFKTYKFDNITGPGDEEVAEAGRRHFPNEKAQISLLRGQGASFRAKQIILGSWELLDCGLNTSYQWCSPIQSIC